MIADVGAQSKRTISILTCVLFPDGNGVIVALDKCRKIIEVVKTFGNCSIDKVLFGFWTVMFTSILYGWYKCIFMVDDGHDRRNAR